MVAKAGGRRAKGQGEMGGKNPLVVLADADLDMAVNVAANGAFMSTGQRCTASSRLIVQDGIHDRFVAALLDKLQSWRVGHALQPDTHIGPVVDQAQLDTDLRYLEIGSSEGAKLAWGGRLLEPPTRGFFLEPALSTDSLPALRMNHP